MSLKEQIREKEREYWQLWAALERERFKRLFNPGVLAWPGGLPRPVGKEWFDLWTDLTFGNIVPGTFEYELGEIYVKVSDARNATGYLKWRYRAELRTPPGPRLASGHLAHIWFLNGDWTIIGGMSVADSTPQALGKDSSSQSCEDRKLMESVHA